MNTIKGKLTRAMCEFFAEDDHQITHALEVLRHAERLVESRSDYDYETLVAVAILHDVGIKISVETLGKSNGNTQEEYGPPAARAILEELGFEEDKTVKVCEMVGNHHSPSRYDYAELEILKDADRIVNRKGYEAGTQ
jgi:HD superfamily phosphodiesterase